MRAIHAQRPQPLGKDLLHHQHPPHVGVLDDADPRRGLVHDLRDVAALDAILRVGERIQIRRRQRRHRLHADEHAGLLNDLE
ncbi:MAG: hypothetical protein ACK559_39270, partial [bacterium]